MKLNQEMVHRCYLLQKRNRKDLLVLKFSSLRKFDNLTYKGFYSSVNCAIQSKLPISHLGFTDSVSRKAAFGQYRGIMT